MTLQGARTPARSAKRVVKNGSNSSASAVNVRPLLVRLKSRTPNSSSRKRIWWLTPDGVTNSSSPASATFKWVAATWNARSARSEGNLHMYPSYRCHGQSVGFLGCEKTQVHVIGDPVSPARPEHRREQTLGIAH